MTDLLRHPSTLMRAVLERLLRRDSLGLTFGDPHDDLSSLDAGELLRVSAFHATGRKIVAGRLILHQGAVSWQRYRPLRGYADGIALEPPLHWIGREQRDGWQERLKLKPSLQVVVIQCHNKQWRFAVPNADIPLVQAAVNATS